VYLQISRFIGLHILFWLLYLSLYHIIDSFANDIPTITKCNTFLRYSLILLLFLVYLVFLVFLFSLTFNVFLVFLAFHIFYNRIVKNVYSQFGFLFLVTTIFSRGLTVIIIVSLVTLRSLSFETWFFITGLRFETYFVIRTF
jgi:hypothetical protein